MGLIDQCLSEATVRYNDINHIVVTIGPGSFTGVRVGMSVARGLALSLDVPVVGVSTLDACEAEVSTHEDNLISLLDAKRGELYAKLSGEAPFVSTYQDLEQLLKDKSFSACGSGANILNRETGLIFPILHENSAPIIETVARLGFEASKASEANNPIEPLYLRSADAKVQIGFALERL